jgi:hypothetical protein
MFRRSWIACGVLSGVVPADAPLLIKSARELGFKGTLSTETARDIKILNEVAVGWTTCLALSSVHSFS